MAVIIAVAVVVMSTVVVVVVILCKMVVVALCCRVGSHCVHVHRGTLAGLSGAFVGMGGSASLMGS